MTSADEVERAIGEIGKGKRKAGSIPMQKMCSLVQFVRDLAKRANAELTERRARLTEKTRSIEELDG